MNCPVCGKDMGGLYWTHLRFEHGIDVGAIQANLETITRYGCPCLCGKWFSNTAERLEHFAKHGKECLLIWNLSH